MLVIQSNTAPLKFNNQFFKIESSTQRSKLNILMVVSTDDLTTKYLPQTYHILQSQLPAILQHKCFNSFDLPFSEELKNTELGHLFEHILLEYLSLIKFEKGYQNVSFTGETRWDWKKEDRGIFHIDIKLNKADRYFIDLAIKKAITLMNLIMLSKYSFANPSLKFTEYPLN